MITFIEAVIFLVCMTVPLTWLLVLLIMLFIDWLTYLNRKDIERKFKCKF